MFQLDLVTRADLAITAAQTLLSGALVLTVLRLWRGPSLPDRILALDMLSFVAMGLLAVHVVRTGEAAFLDAAAVLGLTAFLATVALARLVETRADHAVPPRLEEEAEPPPAEPPLDPTA
jgi:multicomponent Na+:H+ antiporter subunit F